MMNDTHTPFVTAFASALVMLFGGITTRTSAQRPATATPIAPDGTVVGPLASSAHSCASRVETSDGRETLLCEGASYACVTVWNVDVAPIAGRERGLVCANGPLDDALHVGIVEGLDEQRRRALIVAQDGAVLVDTGELWISGLRFSPLPLLGEERPQVVLSVSYEDPWTTMVLDWGAPGGRARVIFNEVTDLFVTSANLNGASEPGPTITSCSGTWTWSAASRRFTRGPGRPGRTPAICRREYD